MKFLIAVDDSMASNKAVQFLGQMLGSRTDWKGFEITLFHVVESLPEFIVSRSEQAQAGGAFRQVADEWYESNRAAGESLVESVRRALVTAGIPGNVMASKLVVKDARPEARRVVAALAIIEEMKQGGYDVVVLGRRGSSPQIESFLGSVSEKITREACGKTVWIVD